MHILSEEHKLSSTVVTSLSIMFRINHRKRCTEVDFSTKESFIQPAWYFPDTHHYTAQVQDWTLILLRGRGSLTGLFTPRDQR